MDRTRLDQQYHDLIGPEYDRVVLEPRELATRRLFAPLMPQLPRSGSQLDVGCGSGHGLLRFGSGRQRRLGLDHSAAMLAQARQNLSAAGLADTELRQTEVLQGLGADSERFDLITVIGFLHHQPPQSLGTFAAALAARLATGGALLVAEPIWTEQLNEPELIRRWNRVLAPELPAYREAAEEPEEAPIPLATLRAALVSAGLTETAVSRGWELFTPNRKMTPLEQVSFDYMVDCLSSDGIVYAAVWRL